MTTVRELIEELQNFDPEAEVHLAYNYGDHWRTVVAPAVTNVDEEYVMYSDYHSMPKIADEDDYDKHGEGKVKTVVVLR